MDAPPIVPVVPSPNVQRVPGQRRGSADGGFERAFEKEHEAGAGAGGGTTAEQPTPRDLQPRRPGSRKNQDDDGDHLIDLLV